MVESSRVSREQDCSAWNRCAAGERRLRPQGAGAGDRRRRTWTPSGRSSRLNEHPGVGGLSRRQGIRGHRHVSPTLGIIGAVLGLMAGHCEPRRSFQAGRGIAAALRHRCTASALPTCFLPIADSSDRGAGDRVMCGEMDHRGDDLDRARRIRAASNPNCTATCTDARTIRMARCHVNATKNTGTMRRGPFPTAT